MDRNANLENENTLISIYTKFPDLIEKYRLIPECFNDEFNRKIFEYFQKYKYLDLENTERFGFSMDEIFLIANRMNECIYSSVESADAMCRYLSQKTLERYKQQRQSQLNDWLRLEQITQADYLEKSKELNDITVVTTDDHITINQINEYIENENRGILIDGFKFMCSKLRIAKGDVITFGGTTGFGKSAFMLNLYSSMMNDKQYKCHYFNLEVSESVMYRRLVSIKSNIKMFELKKSKDEESITKAKNDIIESDSYIRTGSITIDDLKRIVSQKLDKSRTNVVFVDHVGLLECEDRNIRTEYDRVTYNMKQLRNLALNNNLIVMIASQFDRSSIKSDNIGLSSFKSSGEIENSSTHVVVLKKCNEEKYDLPTVEIKDGAYITLSVMKNRNGEVGNVDYYYFDKPTQKMKEVIR